jgi:hypothetical protein
MVVTIGIGAAFGVAAAIAAAVAAGFAFEIRPHAVLIRPPLGNKLWVSDADSDRRAARPRRARVSRSASVRPALVEIALVGSPDRLVLLDLGGGSLGGQRELEFELGSVERVCCLVGSHQW